MLPIEAITANPSPSQRAKTRHAVFTNKLLDNLPASVKPGSQWEWHYDVRAPGLAVGIGHTGIKTFYLIRKFDGKARRFLIGKYPGMSLEDARKTAQAYTGKLAQGIDPKADHSAMTFGDLFEKFMREHSLVRNRTAQQNIQHYERYIATQRYGINLARKCLKDVQRDDIRKLFNGMSAHAPVHANRILALIRSVFNRAISWDLWDKENPCRGIQRNPEISRERFLSHAELPYFFRALDIQRNDTLRAFVFIALFTGARRSNVLSMRWEDVDPDTATWRIALTKNGLPQTVPLVPPLVELLRIRRESIGSEWVFPANSKTGHYVEPKKSWLNLLECATALRLIEKLSEKHHWSDTEQQQAIGITMDSPKAALTMYAEMASAMKIDLKPLDMRDLRVHDLRRTLGSWQANLNFSLAIIGRTLNHLSPQSTKVYARLSLDPVRNAMEAATNAMLNQKQPGK